MDIPDEASSTAPYAQAGILTSDSAYAGTADTPAEGGHVLTVGAGQEYATLAAAIAASSDGDVIAITGGTTLVNDFSYVKKNITIEGVGGMVNMVATEAPPNEKGILVIEGNVTIKNISFSGVEISADSGGNGAGIRYDSGNLTLINDDFHDNQNGILANADSTGTITIDHSTFENNGAGDGYTHDIYIGEVSKFTLTNSIISSAFVGHEVKSRADVSDIENNIIQDGSTGTSSYEIDLPNGGAATVKGNFIEKGPNAENQTMVHFGGEGIPYANSSLDLENNTFVNNYGGTTIALTNSTIDVATVSGNTFDNFASSANLVKGGAELTGNVDGDGTAISNSTQDALTPGDGVWIFTDDQPHSLVFTDYGQAAQGGDGLLTISSDWGHETVIGGRGGLIYTDTGPAAAESGDTITTAIGSINQIAVLGGDTINSRGTDTITLGNGNCTIGVSGTANISGGTGNSTLEVRAGATLALDMTGGSNWFTIASGASATVSGNADFLSGTWSGGQFSYSITQDGTTHDATFIGGGGTAGVYQGRTNITLAGGSVGSNVTLGAGTVTLTSGGADIIHAGSGNDTIIVSGNSTIYAGSGQLSVFGRGESGVATVYGNGGTTLIDGDSGGIDYIGDSQAASIVDNLSYTEIDGRSGHLTITGTGWVRTINGGSGGIDVINALGGDTITTAAGSTNTISMVYGADIYSNGSDTITCGSWGVNIIATGNATITGGQGNSHYTLDGTDFLTSYASDAITIGDRAIATVIASGTVANITDNGGTIHFSGISQGDDIDATLTGVGTIYTWGGSNSSTITTGTTGAVVTLAKGNDHVISLGADDITTGSGNDYIQASSQGDRIHIVAESDAHSITIGNLSATADTIDFSGFTSTPIVSQTLDSSDLVVHLSDGSTMTANGFDGTLSTPVNSQTATIARQNSTVTLQGDNDTVSVTGNADTLAFYGNNATVAISGNFAQTTITGDSASVTVSGSWDTAAVNGSDNSIRVTGQNDTVSIGAGGTTTIDASGASDAIIQFGSGISADQLWFSRNGDDLLVSVIGTNEQTDLQNWYTGTSSDISQFETADGHALLNTQVSNLVDAMASLSAPAPGQTTLSTTQATQLEPVIAANWH